MDDMLSLNLKDNEELLNLFTDATPGAEVTLSKVRCKLIDKDDEGATLSVLEIDSLDVTKEPKETPAVKVAKEGGAAKTSSGAIDEAGY